MTRTSVRLTACGVAVLLSACGSTTFGVEESDLAAKSARIESEIRPGQTTRQEVRARLGTPILESSDWGVELYLSDADVATEWALVLFVPFPLAVREFRLYPLVVYSSSDIVQGVGVGQFAELPSQTGFNAPGGTGVELLGFTLAIDPCDEPWCVTGKVAAFLTFSH